MLIFFEYLFQFLHFLGVGHLFNYSSILFKSSTRPLNHQEIAFAKFIFGQSIDYQAVSIDKRAYLGPRFYKFSYVSLNMINTWGDMHPAHFIHEMMHIWQYQNLGIKYIPRALWAQHFSENGYNYGGIPSLQNALENNKSILDFNYEQQGEIVADYFALTHGYKPKYVAYEPAFIPVFQEITKSLRKIRR